jgi:8-oxo-dGTP pyrophosphatase MutT (NUDIX family)
MTDPLTEEFMAEKLLQAYQPGVVTSLDGYAPPLDSIGLKCAAVLIPLARLKDEWHLLLTRRTDTVEHHKGQVSFPGGGCELDDNTPEDTALREAYEEIGLIPADVRLLGRMNDVITISQFQVSPVVGLVRWPYPFALESEEVARVFTIPLSWLAERKNWDEKPFSLDGRPIPFPVVTYHPYDGETLWGITARMTLNLLKVFDLLNN